MSLWSNKILNKKIENVDKKIQNTCELVKKTDYNTKVTGIENKISSITGLVSTTALNAKVTEIKNKIPDITNLATKTVLKAKAVEIENEIPDTNHFINTHEFNRLTKLSFDVRMKETVKNLTSKSQPDNALYLRDKDRKKIEKLQTFDSSYFSLVKVISKMMGHKII